MWRSISRLGLTPGCAGRSKTTAHEASAASGCADPGLRGRGAESEVGDRHHLLWTANGWVYLAVVMDLFSRKVVGWSLSESLATDLVADALRQAIEARRPVGRQLLHHSDRECQYTSHAYRGIFRTMNIECSMSRTGSCYENAVAERFFWSLKHEWTSDTILPGLEATRRSVFEYIATFYNPVRIHQTLNYKSPDQFDADHAPAVAV